MRKQFGFKKITWELLPYIYFIGLAAFWFLGEFFAMQNFSFIALGIILILIAQAIIQHKTFGVSLGIFAIAVSCVSFLAVLFELSEFEEVSENAIQLLAGGSIITLSGLAMGVMMIKTNGKKLTT
jgi:hypothetical protein